MFTLVYISGCNISPFGDFAKVEFEDIEARSVANNTKHGVTGFLFYHQNRFLQILQGEFDSVMAIFGRVKNDRRHSNLQIIWFSNTEKRVFNRWTMLSSMNYASDHFKRLTIEPSTIARFIPEQGCLSPMAFRALMDMTAYAESALEHNDAAYGGVGYSAGQTSEHRQSA